MNKMKLTVPYTKIVEIVSQKTGKIISLSKLTANTIRIGFDLVVKLSIIGEMSKHFDVVTSIDQIVGSDVYFSMDRNTSFLTNGALFFLKNQSIVEKSDNGFILHLNRIDHLQKIMSSVQIQDISFCNDEAELNFDIVL